jgi:excisionase family DNA binding protein
VTERLLTAIQVAEILNISKAGAYNLMQRGQLPSVKIGRNIRVIPRDLEQFIEDSKQVTGEID